MSQVIAIQGAVDREDVIQQAVERLVRGELVVLPTETRYVVAADALCEPAVERLRQLTQRRDLGCGVLAVASCLRALDFVPDLGPLGQKLLRRSWPGPVTFRIPVASDRRGISSRLPSITREMTHDVDRVTLRAPAHDILQGILRLMPAPLVMLGEYCVQNGHGGALPDWLPAEHAEIACIIDDGECKYGASASLVHVQGKSWQLLHEGVVAERTIRHLASHYILFVCTGNTCRSPMAEGLFRKLLADHLECTDDELGEKGYIVASAGLQAMLGGRPSPYAVDVLRERQIDLSGHQSQPLTPRLLSQADRVYTMTRGHRDAILNEFPDAADRVELLSRRGSDISDPYGNEVDVYQLCAEELEQHLRLILRDLLADEG